MSVGRGGCHWVIGIGFPDTGMYELTIRKPDGKTPHDLRMKAEAEVEKLRADLRVALGKEIAAMSKARQLREALERIWELPLADGVWADAHEIAREALGGEQ